MAKRLLLGVPLGLLTMRSPGGAFVIIPSLALLFLMEPFFGMTMRMAAIALTALTLPPVLINTAPAIQTIDPASREVAVSMGMSDSERSKSLPAPPWQPFGAGGPGIFMTRGFALYDTAILLVGAIPVALPALLAETGMILLRRVVTPLGSKPSTGGGG